MASRTDKLLTRFNELGTKEMSGGDRAVLVSSGNTTTAVAVIKK